jgi:hypothetical protein
MELRCLSRPGNAAYRKGEAQEAAGLAEKSYCLTDSLVLLLPDRLTGPVSPGGSRLRREILLLDRLTGPASLGGNGLSREILLPDRLTGLTVTIQSDYFLVAAGLRDRRRWRVPKGRFGTQDSEWKGLINGNAFGNIYAGVCQMRR